MVSFHLENVTNKCKFFFLEIACNKSNSVWNTLQFMLQTAVIKCKASPINSRIYLMHFTTLGSTSSNIKRISRCLLWQMRGIIMNVYMRTFCNVMLYAVSTPALCPVVFYPNGFCISNIYPVAGTPPEELHSMQNHFVQY